MKDLKVGDIVKNSHLCGIYVVSVIRKYPEGKRMACIKYLDRSYTGSVVDYTEHCCFTKEPFESETWYRVKI